MNIPRRSLLSSIPGATASIPPSIFSALRLCALAATAVLAPYSALDAQTATMTVLHNFAGPTGDGNSPISPLIQARDGNLYGTTPSGGSTNDNGVIYSITPSGQYAIVVEMTYQTNAPLMQASDGNFYGTTTGGHAGTVFELPPGGSPTTIHAFDVTDGRIPWAGLTQGRDGNLYGTTDEGGAIPGTPDDGGTVFSITPGGGTFTLLHSFAGTDGQNPLSAGLVEGSDGYFYGTTESSTPGEGTVYKVSPAGDFQSLHTFTGTDGGDPVGGLLLATDGNFYGTTEGGGVNPPTGSPSGTVFKMTPAGTLTTLYTFTGLADGATPACKLVQGSDGNFYGTTYGGGTSNNGTVFVITPSGKLTTLYSFSGSDGSHPSSGLVQASDGSFYGTTANGGSATYGTVFRLTVHPAFFTGEAALSNGVFYLAFPNGNIFGYYSYLTDPAYIYHFDLGYEYVFDAADEKDGVYLYDFKSSDFFYTSPSYPFPYLYDFGLKTVLYYYPDPSEAGHYNTNGVRYFYDFASGKIISK